jgi:hypothetical protein
MELKYLECVVTRHRTLDPMRGALKPEPSPKGVCLVVKAASFAAAKHRDQRRKDANQTPYINHPLAVANILQECGVDDDEILAAAILHDTVEDTDTTFEDIELLFGSNVMRYVRQVTDDRTLSKVERKKHQVEVAKFISIGARLIKCADKLHNLRETFGNTPKTWTKLDIQGYFVWAKFVTDGARGCNSKLDALLDQIFTMGKLNRETGEAYNLLPDGDLALFLESYYERIGKDKVAERDPQFELTDCLDGE